MIDPHEIVNTNILPKLQKPRPADSWFCIVLHSRQKWKWNRPKTRCQVCPTYRGVWPPETETLFGLNTLKCADANKNANEYLQLGEEHFKSVATNQASLNLGIKTPRR